MKIAYNDQLLIFFFIFKELLISFHNSLVNAEDISRLASILKIPGIKSPMSSQVYIPLNSLTLHKLTGRLAPLKINLDSSLNDKESLFKKVFSGDDEGSFVYPVLGDNENNNDKIFVDNKSNNYHFFVNPTGDFFLPRFKSKARNKNVPGFVNENIKLQMAELERKQHELLNTDSNIIWIFTTPPSKKTANTLESSTTEIFTKYNTENIIESSTADTDKITTQNIVKYAVNTVESSTVEINKSSFEKLDNSESLKTTFLPDNIEFTTLSTTQDNVDQGSSSFFNEQNYNFEAAEDHYLNKITNTHDLNGISHNDAEKNSSPMKILDNVKNNFNQNLFSDQINQSYFFTTPEYQTDKSNLYTFYPDLSVTSQPFAFENDTSINSTNIINNEIENMLNSSIIGENFTKIVTGDTSFNNSNDNVEKLNIFPFNIYQYVNDQPHVSETLEDASNVFYDKNETVEQVNLEIINQEIPDNFFDFNISDQIGGIVKNNVTYLLPNDYFEGVKSESSLNVNDSPLYLENLNSNQNNKFGSIINFGNDIRNDSGIEYDHISLVSLLNLQNKPGTIDKNISGIHKDSTNDELSLNLPLLNPFYNNFSLYPVNQFENSEPVIQNFKDTIFSSISTPNNSVKIQSDILSNIEPETLVNEYVKRVSILSEIFKNKNITNGKIVNIIENLALQSLLSYLLQDDNDIIESLKNDHLQVHNYSIPEKHGPTDETKNSGINTLTKLIVNSVLHDNTELLAIRPNTVVNRPNILQYNHTSSIVNDGNMSVLLIKGENHSTSINDFETNVKNSEQQQTNYQGEFNLDSLLNNEQIENEQNNDTNSLFEITQMISNLVPSGVTFQWCLRNTACAFALATSLAIGATGMLAFPFVLPFGRKKKTILVEESRIFGMTNHNNSINEHRLKEEFKRILFELAKLKNSNTKGGYKITKENIIKYLKQKINKKNKDIE